MARGPQQERANHILKVRRKTFRDALKRDPQGVARYLRQLSERLR